MQKYIEKVIICVHIYCDTSDTPIHPAQYILQMTSLIHSAKLLSQHSGEPEGHLSGFSVAY